VYVILLAITGAGVWATFVKAGQRGWASLVPIYNLLVLLRITHRRPRSFVLFFLPVVNVIFSCWLAIRLARTFGKGAGFGLGLVLLPYVYYPILGFGSARYEAASSG
jgi:hypothetical protein